MNYFALPGQVHISSDFIITDDPLIIGCHAMQESGEIVEVKSLAHIEVLTDMGAKMIRLKQSSLDTVGKDLKKGFRPMVDMGSAFEKFKRDVIFKR